MQTPLPAEQREEVIAQGVQEAVRRGMDSSYRDAIIAGIEASDDEALSDERDDSTNESGKSRRTKVLQGLSVFLVMFATLYVALRRLTDS